MHFANCRYNQRLTGTILIVIFLFLSITHVSAANKMMEQSLKAFDIFCVSTLLDRKIFDANVKLVKNIKIGEEELRNMSPNNEVGYWIRYDGLFIAVIMGKTISNNGSESRNCGVTVKGLTFSDARIMLKTNYPVQKIDNFKQGTSELAIYKASLAGYRNYMLLTIQTGLDMTTVSIVEAPAELWK